MAQRGGKGLARVVATATLLAAPLTVAGVDPATAAPNLAMVRVSVTATGGNPNGFTYVTGISADGRYVVLASDATNLVAGDTNGEIDVFARDVVANTTLRVSVATTGAQATEGSYGGSISADGRYVAFCSRSAGLVAGDTNAADDVFVRDLQAGTTTRASLSASGTQLAGGACAGSLSANGRYLVFSSASPTLGVTTDQLFVRDLVGGSVARATVAFGGGDPDAPADTSTSAVSVSDDGRYVAFASLASNLVATTVPEGQAYRRDLTAGTTEVVARASNGTIGNSFSGSPTMSRDGRYVLFRSFSSNLVSGDTNQRVDAFRRDLVAGTTVRVSVSNSGKQLTDQSEPLGISGDGKVAAFGSWDESVTKATRDTPPGFDIFARDLAAGTTRQLSVSMAGGAPNDSSSDPATISDSGRYVAFASGASNLVPNDNNGDSDVFRADLAKVPAAPGAPTVSSGSAPTVAWSAPAANGFDAPTAYRVTTYRGGLDDAPDATSTIATASPRTASMPDLVAGRAYRFTVAAANGAGWGPESSYSGFAIPPFPAIEGNRGFVTSVYRWMAGRAPTSAEVGSWANKVLREQSTAQALTVSLLDSPWSSTNVAPVIRLYRAYYLRSPDTSGLRYWSTKRSRGTSLATISQSFASATEFTRRYGQLSNRAFVEQVYDNVLGRAGDAGGISFWTRRLDAGSASRGAVMTGFSESDEYVRTSAHLVDPVALAMGLLGRVPTTAELDSWATRTRLQIATELFTGAELATRIASA